jgi:murein DD-endopeptidase MepM/ murein hydrolase activator NlpD
MKPYPASKSRWPSSANASLALIATLLVASVFAHPANADTATDLQGKIEDKSAELKRLQDEITQYEQQLSTVGTARKTLESEVKRLDISRKKISTDIAITQNRIKTAELKIQDLENQIGNKQESIDAGRATIESSLRSMGRLDEVTVAEHFLSGVSLTDSWEEADRLRQVQSVLGTEITRLAATKVALGTNRDTVSKEQKELLSYKSQLSGQKVVLDQNRQNQAGVLSDTKNKESNYQKILEEKKAAALELEQEISNYESQIKYSFDPSAIPSPGSGVISFPLDQSYIFGNIYCITQYFGNTAFAKSGAYRGKGHNGVDFGAPEGTKVLATLTGTIKATGNTDAIRGCYSYGKWVLIEHPDGLSSLYAHLSYIGVSTGQSVGTGDFLGLSGQTGYATGPHLHFSLLATNAAKILRLGDIKSVTNCAGAIVPVAATAGYLNPVQYF